MSASNVGWITRYTCILQYILFRKHIIIHTSPAIFLFPSSADRTLITAVLLWGRCELWLNCSRRRYSLAATGLGIWWERRRDRMRTAVILFYLLEIVRFFPVLVLFFFTFVLSVNKLSVVCTIKLWVNNRYIYIYTYDCINYVREQYNAV